MFKINMFKHVSTCEKSAYKHIVWTYGKLLVGYNENYMISMISIWNHLPNASFVFSQNCHRLLGLTLRRHYETEKAPKHVKIWNCHLFWPFWLSKSLNLDRIFKRVFCCARNFWHSLWGIESIQKVTCEGWDNDFWRFFVVPGTKSGKVREMRAQLELIGIVRIVQVISVWVTGCLRCLRRWLRHRWLAVLAVLAVLAMLPVSSSGLNLVNIFQFWQLIWHPFCLTTHLTTLPIFFSSRQCALHVLLVYTLRPTLRSGMPGFPCIFECNYWHIALNSGNSTSWSLNKFDILMYFSHHFLHLCSCCAKARWRQQMRALWPERFKYQATCF